MTHPTEPTPAAVIEAAALKWPRATEIRLFQNVSEVAYRVGKIWKADRMNNSNVSLAVLLCGRQSIENIFRYDAPTLAQLLEEIEKQ